MPCRAGHAARLHTTAVHKQRGTRHVVTTVTQVVGARDTSSIEHGDGDGDGARANDAAKFSVQVRGYTQDDEDKLCLDLFVDFVSVSRCIQQHHAYVELLV